TGSSPKPLNAQGVPVNRPNQWYFYSSIEEVDQLIEALNPRDEAERSPCPAPADTLMEVRLRDLLLDLEDRIHQGSLGTLKVMGRQVWRSALEAGNYELLGTDGKDNATINGQVEPMEMDSVQLRARDRCSDRLLELKSEASATCGTSGSETPQVISSSVRILAQALCHIEQGIERRFLKPPLDIPVIVVFVHLSSLERSILWSRSVLNARCRICRRKGDADNMLLCDGCDRGHHTHCLRPRLKARHRGNARLSNEVLAPKSNVKSSPGQREVSKRPSAGETSNYLTNWQ
ncbi:hypothetical protein GOODEAATRI_026985, partial [Goodea atripinnis]